MKRTKSATQKKYLTVEQPRKATAELELINDKLKSLLSELLGLSSPRAAYKAARARCAVLNLQSHLELCALKHEAIRSREQTV